MALLHRLAQSPIIAAVRSPDKLEEALNSNAANLFIMGGSLNTLPPMVKAAKAQSKGVFVHLDLIRGLSSTDKESLEFIREQIDPDGIITPKGHLIKEAKRIGLHAILHLFVIDSLAMANGLSLSQSIRPDAIEVMPGTIAKVVSHFAESLPDIPIVSSGLIQSREEAAEMLNAGATALSVSEQTLWQLSFSDLCG
ncbi:glycerol-3-phosphate responsive antiterminator [Cohnella fermenti]|uniref:Glycerol uptake operon antiterminator regulatory protein n=1 Tax=Cohnella fermenti TaxID=2565925 RepID=A0A4V3WE41_9BACL|nr:glycerol-3-phosphate responsive antiterminator [Cohnella fermenti]THF74813.1 glycerol-3-phosphate responsive antiterminator [Cohnella fermenti]